MAKGRKRGSRNKGYFYRSGRGWFVKDGAGRFVPLTTEEGERLRAKDTPETAVKEAHARFLLAKSEEAKPEDSPGMTAEELADYYLTDIERSKQADTTRQTRADMLFDFCTGYGRKWREAKAKPKTADRIHAGFGQLEAEQIQPFHIRDWLGKHPGWGDGTARLGIQAIKRMLNFGVDAGLIKINPIKGMKTPEAGARITYITPEQEEALLAESRHALSEAVTVLIRTGMRPIEFARVTARHVHDHGERMELHFRKEEVKTREARIVRIADPVTIELIREKMETRSGRIFRNNTGGPWLVKSLSRAFLRAKNRAEAKGVDFDADCCLYSCRHTFAKRVLTGYWSGRPISIEVLALLMGNSPEICRSNYLKWCHSYTQPLWDAISVGRTSND